MPRSAQTLALLFSVMLFPDALIAQTATEFSGCAVLEKDSPSGVHVIDAGGGHLMTVYCDNEMEAGGRRGGWMLVWSNLRGGAGDPATDLSWWVSLNTPPRFSGVLPSDSNPSARQFFEVFTGLNWWVTLGGAAETSEMVYEWAANYSDSRRIDQSAYCQYRLDPADSYRIVFDVPTCAQRSGNAGLPGLFTKHNGQKWSTTDVENDVHEATNCSASYSRTPFWYSGCWSGSINGSGERYSSKHKNGAYWIGSAANFATTQTAVTGEGAGSGWIYVRPLGAGH